MQQSTETPRGFRFGVFEVDLRAGEVRKDGRKVKLQEQPFQVLTMLLERAGEVVTREELQKKLWAEDTFVDFDHSLNISINKIREALGDSAERPRFVETLPKRGYRFIAQVLPVVSPVSPAVAVPPANDPNRLHDVAVVRIELDKALTPKAKVEPAPASEVSPQKRWQPKILWGASGLALLALASVTTWYLKPTALKPVARLTMGVSPAEQLRGLNCPIVALSPDGSHVAFVGTRSSIQQLYVRAMDSLEAKAIPGTEGAFCTPFFSPDGQWLAFFSTGKLKKVSLRGGPPVTLANAVGIQGGSWRLADTIIFADPNVGGLLKVSAAGGTPQLITTVDPSKGETGHRWPVLLPGGKALVFAVLRGGSPDDAQIVVQRLDTGERKVLVEGGTYPGYVPTGHLVYVRAGTLMGVPFDPERMEVTGSPVAVAEDVRESGQGAAQFALSTQGSLVYVPGGTHGNDLTLVWVDHKGKAQSLPAPPGNYQFPRLSPDGNRVLLHTGEGSNTDLKVYDISRDTLTRLTFDGKSQAPTWSPDGKWIAYSTSGPGTPTNLFRKLADGSGAEERLTQSKNIQGSNSWSADGKLLAFMENNSSTGFDIWLLPLEGDRKPQPFLHTPFREHMPAFSPDSRWLAYVSDESGRPEVYVRAVSGPGEKWQISTNGGSEPAWARNGKELFYRDRAGRKMSVVDVTLQPSFTAGKPRLLFQDPYGMHINARNYDVAPDGQRFLMLQPSEQPATQVNVVLNWFEELQGRVPTHN